MSFQRWINEDGKQQKIILEKDELGNFVYDMDIGWQFEQQNNIKIQNGRSITKLCLGALRCVNGGCALQNVDIKPACSLSRIEKQAKGGCQRCKAPLVHIRRNVRVNFKFQGCYGILTNKNVHTHGTYQAKHVSRDTLDRLEQRILEFPAETPKGLLVGTSAKRPLNPPKPVRGIDPELQHLGRVGHYRRMILARNGLGKTGAASLESVLSAINELDAEFPGYLRSPMDIHPRTFCIPFCSPEIVSCVDFRRNHMITDVAYNCFGDGYYLCTTTMLLEDIGKHAVVFQAVLGGLSSARFASYFTALLTAFQFEDDESQPCLFGMLMDFSQAQRMAFAKHSTGCFPQAHMDHKLT